MIGLQEVIDSFHNPQSQPYCVLPWVKTHNRIRLRRGEFSVWAGVNGHGKSLLLSQVQLGLMKQGQKVCAVSPEMRPRAMMVRMSRQAIGVIEPSIDYLRRLHHWTDGRLWFYDQQDTIPVKRILGVARYCAAELGIDHFVIDSLMKCGMGVDDYNAQKAFVDALSTIARDTEMHIHLVAHSRKRPSEHGVMDKFDIKGAGEISDMADNVFTLWRNKPKEAEAAKGVTERESPAGSGRLTGLRQATQWRLGRAGRTLVSPGVAAVSRVRGPAHEHGR